MRRTNIFGLLLAIFVGLSSNAYSQPAEVDRGQQWLNVAQNPTGSWGNTPESLTHEYLATATVLDALQVTGQANTPAYQNGSLWLQSQSAPNTAYLASKISALSTTGIDLSADISLLLSYRNSDGGWGGYVNYQSANFHTALALQALKSVSYSDTNVISTALAYLASTQNTDGGWGFCSSASSGCSDSDSNVYMTALVLQTLSQFKSTYDLQAQITSAASYLLTKQNPDGGFGTTGSGGMNPAPTTSTTYEAALAIMALIESGVSDQSSAISIQDALNYLTVTQQANGSWNDDPYSTALALRAIASSKPNLSISASDITFSNPAPKTGDTITITANIKNTGPAEAPSTGSGQAGITVQFYDGNPLSGGVLIGEATISSIPAFGSSPANITWTIPSAAARSIFVSIDPLNTIDELSETDNIASKNLTSATLPDLSISSADITIFPSAPLPADLVALTATIRNNGETGVSSFSVDIYDGDPSAGGVNIFSTMVPSIGAGSAVAIPLTTSFTAGSHTIYVIVDKANSIGEGDKTNNIATKTIQVGGGSIDLALTREDITFSPAYPIEGNPVTINATIHNEGEAAVNNVLGRFYLGDPDSGGVQIGSDIYISSISDRGTVTISRTWDSTGQAGSSGIYVIIDPLNTISEINELNNRAFRTVTVAAKTGPDLTITSADINFIPLAPNTGDTVTITARVRNIGTSDANNVLAEFSLGDPDVGGTLIIASQTIPFIAMGGSALAQIPWNTSGFSGSYEISVNADPFNAIAELDEKNNLSHGTLEVKAPQGPDLTITSIDTTNLTTDTQALAGSGNIYVTIANKGNQPTGVPFEITAFEDTNKNKQFDAAEDKILGRITYNANLAAGATAVTDIPLSGTILFRDNLIHVMADSGNAIQEINETDNMRSTGQACEYKPPVGAFNPVEKWRWTGSAILPTFNQVMSTPVVANLTDDNGDGLINEKDLPDILFITAEPGDLYGGAPGVLRGISGDNGGELFTVTDPTYRLLWTSTLAAGDIDGDGVVEIIGSQYTGAGTIAFKHDGTVKWTSPYGNGYWGGLSIADIRYR